MGCKHTIPSIRSSCIHSHNSLFIFLLKKIRVSEEIFPAWILHCFSFFVCLVGMSEYFLHFSFISCLLKLYTLLFLFDSILQNQKLNVGCLKKPFPCKYIMKLSLILSSTLFIGKDMVKTTARIFLEFLFYHKSKMLDFWKRLGYYSYLTLTIIVIDILGPFGCPQMKNIKVCFHKSLFFFWFLRVNSSLQITY